MRRETKETWHPGDLSSPRSSDVSRLTSRAALVIFGKAPIPGLVKTRLCPPLTPDEAAALHGSLMLDVVERTRCEARGARREARCQARGAGYEARGGLASDLGPLTSGLFDRFVACAPSREHVFFKILQERQGLHLIDQVGEDLGRRMDQAFQEIFALGYKRLLLVGTDVPTLPASSFGRALGLLSDHDLVLGPSLDGGYYLIGLKKPAPDLFIEIPWSMDQVLALTMKRAKALGLTASLLPPCRDIDTIEDFLALIHEAGVFRSSPLASGLSVRTAGVLRMLADRLRARGA